MHLCKGVSGERLTVLSMLERWPKIMAPSDVIFEGRYMLNDLWDGADLCH